MTPELTEQQHADLTVARELVAAGVPLFLAQPDPSTKAGYRPPRRWEQTRPDLGVVDAWRPGLALCAVMGHGLDLIDVDPRSGGDVTTLGAPLPTIYGQAATPSGGTHLFVRSLGVGSRDGIAPGIDVKAGVSGEGHGFAFIAPTVRVSVVTGEPAAYRWTRAPAGWRDAVADTSGAALAARVRELRGAGVAPVGGPEWWREFLASREPQAAAAADRAMVEKLTEVAEWTPVSGGNFRTVLMAAAMTLGGYVGGGYLDESQAWVRLEQAAAAVWGSADADDRRWIAQGLTDGAARPFHVYTAADELEYGDAAQTVAATREGPSWSPYRALGTDTFDPRFCAHDQELAEAVIARTAPVVRYAADAGTWVVRGAETWVERDDLSGWSVAMVARLMPLGEQPVPKDVTQRTELHWQAVRRQRLMSSAGSGAVERKVRAILRGGEHPAAIELAALDGDPDVLWAGGVPWNLRESLSAPVAAGIDPATPHLRSAAFAPQRRDTPAWDAFLAAVWPDAEVRAWALRVLAITLAGYPDAALPVLYGPERTGKTAVVTLLVRALGSYGHAADPRLLSGADTAHASVVYALKGRRLSFIDEGPRRGHLAAERLKQLTGGGHLTGNAMRANPVTFTPTHTLVMTTNDEPPITDPALRARVRLIPCDADRAEVRVRRQAITAAVWEVEAPGVLAALMAECAAWLDAPDSASTERAPEALRALVDDIAAGQDPVREWVEMCTVPFEAGTSGRELYRQFRAWFEGQPVHRRGVPPTETAFGRTLSEIGYPAFWGGPRGKLKYRGLSVMQGGPDPRWAPLLPQHAAEGVPRGAEASGGEPSAPENPRSTCVSASYADSAEGVCTTTTEEDTPLVHKSDTPTAITEKVGTNPSAVSAPSADTPSPAQTGADGASGTPRQPVGTPRQPVGTPSAGATKADRAAERAAAREAARLDAVAAASGELLGLPAVVDRAGNVIPVSEDQAAAVVRAALARSGALTVDVETSGYPVGHTHYVLRSVQLGDATAAAVLDPVAHAGSIRALLAEAPRLHAHSAAADLVPLGHAGLIDPTSAWERMHDTVIPAKLADPQSTGSDPALKALAAAVLGDGATAPIADAARAALFKAGRWLTETRVDTPPERSGWSQVDTACATMLRYAASDVLDTAALAERLPAAPVDVHERERLAQRMTARVAHRGVRIDAERVRALTDRHTASRAAAAQRVREFGVDNPGSNPQVGAKAAELGATLPLTKAGAPSVAEGVLDPLRAAEGPLGAFVRAVLDYRHDDTVLGLFLTPYRTLCEYGDGRARPTVYTLGTDTGRMCAVRPNLQQLPREGGVRACITADPGHVLISADFSGVEIRVAAALSGDPTLVRLLADGRDLHGEVAKIVWGADATMTHRYQAKRIVFGRLYGGGIPTLATQARVDEATATRAVDALDALTPGLSAWSAAIRDAVRQGRTQFPSYAGRVIHLPRGFPHKGPNYCVGMTTPVLRSDLTHVAAAEIRVGDRLVGFDEHPQDGVGGQNRYHHLRTAVVEAVSTVVKPSVKVHTIDGKVTECSTDHLWLVRPLKGRKNNRPRVRWVRADALRPGDDLLSLGTWDVADGRTAGYVAGLYDGEGSLTRHAGGRRKNQLFFSQNRGPVMDAMRSGMDELGLPYSYYDRTPNSTSTTDSVVVSGLRNVMRTLGALQPERFRPRFEELYEGNAITAGLTESVAVTAIENAGEIELASIQTSTRTLVANGYLSHNCIQGTARELLVDALVRWRATRWGDATLLPVHDELIVFVPAEDADEATAELVRCMEGSLYGVDIVAKPSVPVFAWADSS